MQVENPSKSTRRDSCRDKLIVPWVIAQECENLWIIDSNNLTCSYERSRVKSRWSRISANERHVTCSDNTCSSVMLNIDTGSATRLATVVSGTRTSSQYDDVVVVFVAGQCNLESAQEYFCPYQKRGGSESSKETVGISSEFSCYSCYEREFAAANKSETMRRWYPVSGKRNNRDAKYHRTRWMCTYPFLDMKNERGATRDIGISDVRLLINIFFW